ncbi:hypothetical protein CTRI78_v009327 [Colletotrichum trifolii]|uniref:Uncharacterized protein n=1 Tax=Colletotrichum trifolii TaxID=5466 RepID=A0A4R8QY18_COLTR|nr:hypothetical protein CTRI78_v009327 [Colletotrichum trifolii]
MTASLGDGNSPSDCPGIASYKQLNFHDKGCCDDLVANTTRYDPRDGLVPAFIDRKQYWAVVFDGWSTHDAVPPITRIKPVAPRPRLCGTLKFDIPEIKAKRGDDVFLSTSTTWQPLAILVTLSVEGGLDIPHHRLARGPFYCVQMMDWKKSLIETMIAFDLAQ